MGTIRPGLYLLFFWPTRKDTFSGPQTFIMLKFFKNEQSKISAADEDLNAKKFDEIKVIGAGLPRTGTLSLKTALTQLYGGKCYHMMNVFAGKQEDVDIWIRAFKEEIPPEEWRQFFSDRNFACGVDFPFSMHYKQLMKAYPDAKVVLSVRDPRHGTPLSSHPSTRLDCSWKSTQLQSGSLNRLT